MTQKRIDDLQKAIKTGLPIEINPKTVLELISMLETEKRRADAAVNDLTCLANRVYVSESWCPRCDYCSEMCNEDSQECLGNDECFEWRGPCAANTPEVSE
jgi:hypothetical protein